MPDPRFARLTTDPRFRRPRRQRSKIVVDDRFKEVFDQGKNNRGGSKKTRSVDKYGRVLPNSYDQDNLRRFYSLENNGEDTSLKDLPPAVDYARGEVLLESSDEEGDEKSHTIESEGVMISEPGPSRFMDWQTEIDLNENDFADLDAQAVTYARHFLAEDEQQEVTRTRRLAVVNLDWDHVKATHLFKIFSSLVSPTAPIPPSSSLEPQRSNEGDAVRGKVLSVRVYPSAFGKERLSQEEKDGPPIELFKKKLLVDEDEVNGQNIYEVGDENDCDNDALRNYQLMRLRYYYAIVTCDTVNAASHIYSELEGTELERSANVFDLSFVPDDMTFEDDPRDEALEDQVSGYKGADFVTPALRHSKVKLTWDEEDPERTQITRRTLTRQEIEESDFKAYLASSTSGSESESEPFNSTKSEKSQSRDVLRALLLGPGDRGLPEGWGDDDKGDVDMEITFTPALNSMNDGKDETTLAKYQRMTKEKRKKRKERANQKGGEREKAEDVKDDFFEVDGREGSVSVDPEVRFKKEKKDADRHAASANSATTAEELALLIASDKASLEPKHFSLKSVLKAEKASRLKGKRKRGKGSEEIDETQDDFAINLNDDRFKSLHEDHTFAIDPSNPHFKKTKSMVALMEERAKVQKRRMDSGPTSSQKSSTEGKRNLQSLVESVKQKTALHTGIGKRQKL